MSFRAKPIARTPAPSALSRMRPLVLGSSPTYVSPQPHAISSQLQVRECDDECAEEECNAEQCGNEQGPPSKEQYICGLDTRPLLPLTLSVSTALGGASMVMLQAPLLESEFGVPYWVTVACIGTLYLTTLGLMAHCAFADPGQMRRDQVLDDYSAMQVGAAPALPRRSHKTWLYSRPVRRYDHYCRWVTNCIGLLNHREFVLMCMGLVFISSTSIAVDIALGYALLLEGSVPYLIMLGAHIVYSLILLFLAGPILKIHVGLVSRNELAHEWKRNEFYIALKCSRGKKIPANELSDEEFNSLFDSLTYDQSLNRYDKESILI